MALLRAWLQQAYWQWMLRTSRRSLIDGMAFIYISAADDRSAAEIEAALSDAMERVRAARDGFPELVGDHLRFVAALDAPTAQALPRARGYVSPFAGPEGLNTHFLACRLVWASTYIRLTRDAVEHKQRIDPMAIKRAAHEAQVRFTARFPDAEEWLDYLKRHPLGP